MGLSGIVLPPKVIHFCTYFLRTLAHFEPDKAYTKFYAYALLNHGADFKAAAKALAEQGFGDQIHLGTGRRKKAGADSEPGRTYPLGSLKLQPGRANKTKSGKFSFAVTVSRDGAVIDQFRVNDTPSGRKDVAKIISRHLPEIDQDEIFKVLGGIIADTAANLEKEETDGERSDEEWPSIFEIVVKEVPPCYEFTYRTDRGAWSEVRGREVTRSEFISFVPTMLVEATEGARDAPRNENTGEVNRRELIKAIKVELEVLWSDLYKELTVMASADLKKESKAGQKFREAMVKLWTATKTFEKTVEAGGDSVASRASLVSRAKNHAKDFLDKKVTKTSRVGWKEIQAAFSAWWRPVTLDDGEITILLAMRWELTAQIGDDLPGVCNQEDLTALGDRFGVLETDPPVTARLSGGTRLAVLSLELTRELLEKPLEDP